MDRQKTFDEETSLPMPNLKKLVEQKKTASNKNDYKPKYRYFRFVFKQKLYEQYNDLHIRYLREKKAYRGNFSHNVFFPTCVNFLVQEFKEQKIYKKAPEPFISMITRRGRRRKTERSSTKEDQADLFIRVEPDIYDRYINLIYSYAQKRDDAFNKDYSTAYFFEDFKELIKDNFKKLVKFDIGT